MELIFNAVIGIFLTFFLVFSLLLDKKSITGDVFGAGGFPIVLAVLGLCVLTLIIRKSLKDKSKVYIALFDIKSQSGKAVILNAIILTAYLLFMNIIGFLLSTLIFVFGSTRAMGYKKLHITSLFTIFLSVILVFIFGRVFLTPLPRGIGLFRELSYFIY